MANQSPPTLLAPHIAEAQLRRALAEDAPDAAVTALFARAPTVCLRVPSLWPGACRCKDAHAIDSGTQCVSDHSACTCLPSQPLSRAQVCWSAKDGLLLLFSAGPPFQQARDDPRDKMSILKDSRVEAFVWPVEAAWTRQGGQEEGTAAAASSAAAESSPAASTTAANSQAASSASPDATLDTDSSFPLCRYVSYEMNSADRVLDFTCAIPRQMDYAWSGDAQLLASWEEGASSASASKADKGHASHSAGGLSAAVCHRTTRMLLQLPWTDFCSPQQRLAIAAHAQMGHNDDPPAAPCFHLGLYRGEVDLQRSSDETVAFTWQSWRDPLAASVDFHVPDTFGRLTLLPPAASHAQERGAEINTQSANPSPAVAASSSSCSSPTDCESLTDLSLIVPRLYQGSMLSLTLAALRSAGITRVVNCAAGEVRAPSECYADGSGVRELKMYLDDSLEQDLFNVAAADSEAAGSSGCNIIDACRWLEAAISEGRSVLVHCAQGKSRSAAVVLLFLIRSRRMHVHDALRLLQRARPVAQPNPAFMRQLRAYCDAEEIAEAGGQ